MSNYADHHPAAVAPSAAEPEKKKREYKDMEEKHEGDLHAKVDMNTVSTRTVSNGAKR
jgi:H+-transporting ATPase